MRTNIDLDDDLIKTAMRVSGSKTKRAAVEMALQLLIRLQAQEGARALRGAVEWEGDLDAMRARRSFEASFDEQ